MDIPTLSNSPSPSDLLYFLTLPTALGELSAELQRALQAELELVRLAPNDTLFRQHFRPGTVIGVNLSPPRASLQGYNFGPSISGWQILWSRLNPFAKTQPEQMRAPSLMSILLRAQEVHGIQSVRATQGIIDLLIEPPVEHIRFDNYEAYDEVHDIGYQAAVKALATWDRTNHRW